MAKRQVFFSFHFDKDIWRVGQVRNIGAVDGQEIFFDNGWEKVRLKSDMLKMLRLSLTSKKNETKKQIPFILIPTMILVECGQVFPMLIQQQKIRDRILHTRFIIPLLVQSLSTLRQSGTIRRTGQSYSMKAQ